LGADRVLYIRVTAKAAQNRVGGLQTDAEGRDRLKIAVTAPPADGAANTAVIKTLAKALRVPKSAITIAAGAADRNKRVVIKIGEGGGGATPSPDGQALDRRLAALCGGGIS